MDIDTESLTGTGNYFEDFQVGQAIRHERGKTLAALDQVLITNMVMNTAQAHFNADYADGPPFNGIISYGGVNVSFMLGLATQDCCENALEELSLDKVRLLKPVRHGDTIYAYSEVVSKDAAERNDAGIICFRHSGYNQRDELIASAERRALIKRRSHWCGEAGSAEKEQES